MATGGKMAWESGLGGSNPGDGGFDPLEASDHASLELTE